MSAVFGFAKVTKTVPLAENRIAHVVYDCELNAEQCVIFNQQLPIGTKLYWEFDCRDKKTRWMLAE
jgi:hypothetical protein